MDATKKQRTAVAQDGLDFVRTSWIQSGGASLRRNSTETVAAPLTARCNRTTVSGDHFNATSLPHGDGAQARARLGEEIRLRSTMAWRTARAAGRSASVGRAARLCEPTERSAARNTDGTTSGTKQVLGSPRLRTSPPAKWKRLTRPVLHPAKPSRSDWSAIHAAAGRGAS